MLKISCAGAVVFAKGDLKPCTELMRSIQAREAPVRIPRHRLYVSAIKQLEAAENHQPSQNDKPKLRREHKGADRTDSYDKKDQSEQLHLSWFSAAEHFSKSHTDHILYYRYRVMS